MTRVRATAALALAVASLAGAGAAAGPAGAAAPGVQVTGVTVTAARAHGDSAVVLTFANRTRGPVSLLAVTSPAAATDMIDYDQNMCQGGHLMTWLGNILIPAGATQRLGYKYQGAMLFKLRQSLVVGTVVALSVEWTDFHAAHATTVEARVVAPPRGIFFGMSPMRM